MPRAKQIGAFVSIHCPGCDREHTLRVKTRTNANDGGPAWSWNGDLDLPTFSPSLLVYASNVQPRCHSFIEAGRIQFLPDCDHALVGETVDLPEFKV